MKIFGSINVLGGILVAVVPSFNNCPYEGKLPTLAFLTVAPAAMVPASLLSRKDPALAMME